jgi:hypothetical protein
VRVRAASPIEPPISPTPITATCIDPGPGDTYAAVNALPAIAAACSTLDAYRAKPSVRSACGPSQIASSGDGCTSTMIPSAPAAAAASDSG